MNALRLSTSAALRLLTVLGVMAVATAAFADEGEGRHVRKFLDAMAQVDLEPAAETAFAAPSGLSLAEALQDEDDMRNEYRRADYTRVRDRGKPAFFDFKRFEMGGYIGIVDYSGDFEADPSYVLGISARVPVTGLPLGEWGIWAQLHLSYIRRDIPFYYKNSHGNWLGLSVGGDYTFYSTKIWYIRAQLGVMYAHWNDIQALDNGMGVLAGLQFGFFWIKNYDKAIVTITPQLSYDGENFVAFMTFGFSVDF
jgi:hypothetical protein